VNTPVKKGIDAVREGSSYTGTENSQQPSVSERKGENGLAGKRKRKGVGWVPSKNY